MKNIIRTIALSLAMIGSAHAATFQSVVPEKSSITFSYKQMGVTMDGRFKKFNAKVQLNTARLPQAKGSIEIDLTSIDTGSSEADQEVLGKAWFNTASHPKGVFQLKSIIATGPDQYRATGQLTLKGQTREIVLPVRLTPQGLLTGSFDLKRAEYGIGEGIWSKFDVVANDITVKFNLNLK